MAEVFRKAPALRLKWTNFFNLRADGASAELVQEAFFGSSTLIIACTVGNADAAGASAAFPTIIECGIGNATADGSTAAVTGITVIACSVGNAVADGLPVGLDQADVITCGIGNAVAAGATATIDQTVVITCGIGNAVADGVPASLPGLTIIECSVGAAVADGLPCVLDAESETAIVSKRRIGPSVLSVSAISPTFKVSRRIGATTLRRAA